MGNGRRSERALACPALRAAAGAAVALALGCANRGNPSGANPVPASQAEQAPAVAAESNPLAPVASGVHAAGQGSAAASNTADNPWSLAELRKSASADAGLKVWLAGYVNMADCSQGRPDAPKPCLLASFADHPFSGGAERILIGGVPDSWEKLPPRARVRVRVSYDRTLLGPLPFAPGKEALNYIDQLEPKPLTPANPQAATFADGSWSIGDLFTRDDLTLDTSLEVTAYVTSHYECPPCPPTAICKPCAMPSVTLGDTRDASVGPSLIVAGFAGNSLPATFNPEQRYTFGGVLRAQVSGWSSDRGATLEYRSHKVHRD